MAVHGKWYSGEWAPESMTTTTSCTPWVVCPACKQMHSPQPAQTVNPPALDAALDSIESAVLDLREALRELRAAISRS